MSQNENSLKNKHASDGHTHHHEHKKNETRNQEYINI